MANHAMRRKKPRNKPWQRSNRKPCSRWNATCEITVSFSIAWPTMGYWAARTSKTWHRLTTLTFQKEGLYTLRGIIRIIIRAWSWVRLLMITRSCWRKLSATMTIRLKRRPHIRWILTVEIIFGIWLMHTRRSVRSPKITKLPSRPWTQPISLKRSTWCKKSWNRDSASKQSRRTCRMSKINCNKICLNLALSRRMPKTSDVSSEKQLSMSLMSV